jgi:glycosylphosphatidylinositol transamidase
MAVPAPSTTQAKQSSTDSHGSHKKPPVPSFVKRKLWLLIAVPYIVGILWTCAHPVVSIVTGELKCRGWFIDENSLDAGNFRYDANFQLPSPKKSDEKPISSLCQALDTQDIMGNVKCYRFSDSFEVAKLVPISNAITPVSEAIALVIPSSDDWLADPYHNSMLQFMKRLASSNSSPWLAKTVLLISPTASTNQTLTETVSSFLNSYLGTGDSSITELLPPSFTTAMIRNLLVLNVSAAISDTAEKPLNEIRLMPQGRRGILPNMDLVFLVMTVISRATFLDSRRYDTNFIMHPHTRASKEWHHWVASQSLPPSISSWLDELGDLVLFIRTLAVGPYPAHAPTLERGIDSLTLELYFSGTDNQASFVILDFVKRLEGMVRALSNLHERLHHSMTQYLMPSPFKFVSHSEYLIPNLLFLLPLVVRAVSIILWRLDGLFCFSACQVVLMVAGIALVVHHFSEVPEALTVPLVLVYGLIPAACSSLKETLASYQSLHFLTCLVAIYIMIPLILGHVSLALPSVVLWSFVIAMLSHRHKAGGGRMFRRAVVLPLLLLLTWPPIWVQQFFGDYSPYVVFVHLPLHLLASVLWYRSHGLAAASPL